MLSDMTKGPWHVVAYDDGYSLVICEDEAGDKRIAFMAVPGTRFVDERRKQWTCIKADAQAIAALPDLIEALEWIDQNYEGYMSHVDFRVEAKHRAQAALTKAGGPQ